MSKFDVLGIGTPTIDIIKNKIYPGGNIPNVLVTLSRLGLKTSIIGRIGNDEYGKKLKRYFIKEKVNMNELRIDEFPTSMVKFNKIRKIVLMYKPLDKLSSQDKRLIRNTKAIAVNAKNILFQQVCKLKNKKIFVLFQNLKPDKKIYELLEAYPPNIIFSNEQEAELNSEIINKLVAKNSKAIITLGNRGCKVLSKNKTFFSSALDIKSVSDIGAGDAFMGGFIFGVLKKWSTERTALFANALAALSTTKVGATTVRVTYEKMNKILER